MTENETSIVIDGKKYVITKTKAGADACKFCAIEKKCKETPEMTLCGKMGVADDEYFRLADENGEASAEYGLTEKAAHDDYQKRSRVSGERAETLAWAMIVLLAAQLIGGLKYAEFYVFGGAALLYMLLSAMQSVYQTLTIWIVKCRIKRTGTALSDYPYYVRVGAWLFYWLKMLIITAGAVYGASHFIFFAI